MSKEISRRELLKMMGFGAAGIALGGCTTKREGDPAAITEQPTVKPTIETPTATEQPTVAQTETAKETTGNWPKTSEETAKMFGGEPSDWEMSPDGGWHFIERGECETINPNNYLMEGYYDTAPGKNPFCFVTWGPATIQGGTIWPVAGSKETAEDLIEKMAIPKWDDGSQHPCQIIEPVEKQEE